MRLSVIIPIYNAQKYLRKCLETVSMCSSSEMECILVNDGSKDASLELCQEFVEKDSRFHIINKKNEGVSVARNTGMIHASGQYVFFLDADDYIDTKKWDIILKAIGDDFDFIAFSYYTLHENGEVEEELFKIEGQVTKDIRAAKRLILTTPALNTCWGKLMRRDIIMDNSIQFKRGVKTGEDALFVMDYFQYVKTCSLYNDIVIYYRQHSNSAMHRINMDAKLNDFQALYDYRNKLVKQWEYIELEKEMYRQFFSVVTNLFIEFSKCSSIKLSMSAFKEAEKTKMVREIINKTPRELLTPRYKKLEYLLLKRRMFGILAIYFKFKNQFR